MHKVGNVGLIVLFKFENNVDIVVSNVNFNPQHQSKSKYASQFFQWLTITEIFSLKFVQ